MATRVVGVNSLGRRVGESQTGAKLTDHEVELLLALHEEGWGYLRLSAKFEISKSLARDIVKGRRRSQTATRWKTVHASS